MNAREEQAYVDEIQERYRALRGMPLMLSPEDFERALRWRAEGVPLFVVLEAIDAVFKRAAQRKPRRTPRSLAYCEPAVREAFEGWREGQLGAHREPGEKRGNDAVLEQAAARVAQSKAPAAARDAAAAALRALAAEGVRGPACAARVDAIAAALVAACLAELDADSRAALEEEGRRELEPYAAEMTPAHHARALDAARERLVRQRFAVPDLALLPLH